MKNKEPAFKTINKYSIFFFVFALTACSEKTPTPVAEEIFVATITVEATDSNTPTLIPPKSSTPTQASTHTPTAKPTTTPSQTTTPTSTPTPTITLAPFDTSECVDLISHPDNWNLMHSNGWEEAYPYYDSYDGKCVRFFAGGGIGKVVADLIYTTVTYDLVIDDFTPSDVVDATEIKSSFINDYRIVAQYSTVWGAWNVVESGEYEVLLRKIEPFQIDQQPIIDDGIYNVGNDSTVIPGKWKSIAPSTDCYWARIDPSTGSIKQNHFGIGGIYTRLQDGDLFESENCAPWVFIEP